jgi:hypothetical protein
MINKKIILLFYYIEKIVEYKLSDDKFNVFIKYYIPEYCNITKLCIFEDKLYDGCDINHLILKN